MRASCADDDQILTAMMPVLDAFYTAFGPEISQESAPQETRESPWWSLHTVWEDGHGFLRVRPGCAFPKNCNGFRV